jgi:hypothetical protein
MDNIIKIIAQIVVLALSLMIFGAGRAVLRKITAKSTKAKKTNAEPLQSKLAREGIRNNCRPKRGAMNARGLWLGAVVCWMFGLLLALDNDFDKMSASKKIIVATGGGGVLAALLFFSLLCVSP